MAEINFELVDECHGFPYPAITPGPWCDPCANGDPISKRIWNLSIDQGGVSLNCAACGMSLNEAGAEPVPESIYMDDLKVSLKMEPCTSSHYWECGRCDCDLAITATPITGLESN